MFSKQSFICTCLHPPTGNYYAIDLSLCHPNIYLDFDWSVCDDLHGSDHFPILIKETESSDDEQHDDDDDELKFNDASTHGVILRLEGYTAL